MKFVTFQRHGGAPEPGIVSGDKVIGLTGAGFADMLAVIAAGRDGVAKAADWASRAPEDAALDLKSVTLLAPIPRPPKLICVGLNYRDHAIESKMEIPKVPTIFNKFHTAVIGPGAAIVLPKVSTQPDYEAEMAFVVGPGGRNIPASRWPEHVFGYTIVNDVSARDYQFKDGQWSRAKGFDTFSPIGPAIATGIKATDRLLLTCRLNGEVRQQSS
ncbi:MAG: fumarylacetoacetate hydrolase family protein, partial [bacterium]